MKKDKKRGMAIGTIAALVGAAAATPFLSPLAAVAVEFFGKGRLPKGAPPSDGPADYAVWALARDGKLIGAGDWMPFVASFVLVCLLVLTIVAYSKARDPGREVDGGVLGDASIIASRGEILRRNAAWDGKGASPGPSLVFGYESGKMVGDPSFAHGFVDAKSGAGKSRFLGYESLFWNARCGASIVYSARKLTEYMLTSRAMAREGYRTLLLDLERPKRGHRFNLMGAVNGRVARGDIAGAQREARTLAADFVKHDDKNPYFSNAARALLAAAILIVALAKDAKPAERNMVSVAETIRLGMTGPGKDPAAPLKDYLRSLGSGHPAYKTAAEFLQDNGTTAGRNVASTLMTGITVLGDEGIEWMLSGEDFAIRDILEDRCVLYPHCLGEGDPYNVVLSALYDQLWAEAQRCAEEHGGKLPHPFVLLGDEWGNVPRVTSLGEMVSLGRSLDFHVFLFVQNLSQLNKYNDAGDGGAGVDKLLGSMNLQIAMSVMETRPDGEYFSGLVGKKTVLARSDSQSRGDGAQRTSSSGRSMSEHQVDAIPPYAFKDRVPSRDGIVVVKGGENEVPGHEGVFAMPVADVTRIPAAKEFFGMGTKEEDRTRCEAMEAELAERERWASSEIPSWHPDFAATESEETREVDIEGDEGNAWDDWDQGL